jgi:hypothetical protein
VVAGKGPPGAVCPVPAGRQPDDEQAGPPAAERSDRPAVVVRMLGLDGVEVAREARAEPAARVERGPGPLQRALNCASSVEPRIAVIEELPPVTVCVTSSK